MARRGGYSRSTNEEWMRVNRRIYGEALRSADEMGQDLDVWLTDAVLHHSYRCEGLKVQELYQADELMAAASGRPTPDKTDLRYAMRRPKPTITRPVGQGSAPGSKSYRP